MLNLHMCLGLVLDFLLYSSGLSVYSGANSMLFNFFWASLITSSEHLFFCEGPGSSAVLSHIHASVSLTVTQAHLLSEFPRTQGTPLSELSGSVSALLLCRRGCCFLAPRWLFLIDSPGCRLYKQFAEFIKHLQNHVNAIIVFVIIVISGRVSRFPSFTYCLEQMK